MSRLDRGQFSFSCLAEAVSSKLCLERVGPSIMLVTWFFERAFKMEV